MNKLKKDKRYRTLNKNLAIESLIKRILGKNKILNLKTREAWLYPQENKLSTRNRKYCLLTARSRGVLPQFKVSRIIFKEYATLGLIAGIKPSSW